jgi:hypothetical protein
MAWINRYPAMTVQAAIYGPSPDLLESTRHGARYLIGSDPTATTRHGLLAVAKRLREAPSSCSMPLRYNIVTERETTHALLRADTDLSTQPTSADGEKGHLRDIRTDGGGKSLTARGWLLR